MTCLLAFDKHRKVSERHSSSTVISRNAFITGAKRKSSKSVHMILFFAYTETKVFRRLQTDVALCKKKNFPLHTFSALHPQVLHNGLAAHGRGIINHCGRERTTCSPNDANGAWCTASATTVKSTVGSIPTSTHLTNDVPWTRDINKCRWENGRKLII